MGGVSKQAMWVGSTEKMIASTRRSGEAAKKRVKHYIELLDFQKEAGSYFTTTYPFLTIMKLVTIKRQASQDKK